VVRNLDDHSIMRDSSSDKTAAAFQAEKITIFIMLLSYSYPASE
jgi:hypothetical protein